jgi:hypothetical protein
LVYLAGLVDLADPVYLVNKAMGNRLWVMGAKEKGLFDPFGLTNSEKCKKFKILSLNSGELES